MIKVLVSLICMITTSVFLSCDTNHSKWITVESSKQTVQISPETEIVFAQGSKYRISTLENNTSLELDGAAFIEHFVVSSIPMKITTPHFSINMKSGKAFVSDAEAMKTPLQVQQITGTSTVESRSNQAAVLLSKGQKVDCRENGTLSTVKMLRLIEQDWYYDLMDYRGVSVQELVQELVLLYGHRINISPVLLSCKLDIKVKTGDGIDKIIAKLANSLQGTIEKRKTIYYIRDGICPDT